MQNLFDSGLVIDIALALVVFEALVLWVSHAGLRRGPAPKNIMPTLVAGWFLLLALRGVLIGLAWPWLAGCLTVSLCAHILDLAGRWQNRRSGGRTASSFT